MDLACTAEQCMMSLGRHAALFHSVHIQQYNGLTQSNLYCRGSDTGQCLPLSKLTRQKLWHSRRYARRIVLMLKRLWLLRPG